MPDLELTDNHEHMTLRGAATALKRSERTVRRYLTLGRLSADKVSMPAGGWQYLIHSASVMALQADLRLDMPGGRPGGMPGVTASLEDPRHDMTDRMDILEQENAVLREERDFLREIVRNMTEAVKALPAPKLEAERRSWWGRLIRRGTDRA